MKHLQEFNNFIYNISNSDLFKFFDRIIADNLPDYNWLIVPKNGSPKYVTLDLLTNFLNPPNYYKICNLVEQYILSSENETFWIKFISFLRFYKKDPDLMSFDLINEISSKSFTNGSKVKLLTILIDVKKGITSEDFNNLVEGKFNKSEIEIAKLYNFVIRRKYQDFFNSLENIDNSNLDTEMKSELESTIEFVLDSLNRDMSLKNIDILYRFIIKTKHSEVRNQIKKSIQLGKYLEINTHLDDVIDVGTVDTKEHSSSFIAFAFWMKLFKFGKSSTDNIHYFTKNYESAKTLIFTYIDLRSEPNPIEIKGYEVLVLIRDIFNMDFQYRLSKEINDKYDLIFDFGSGGFVSEDESILISIFEEEITQDEYLKTLENKSLESLKEPMYDY